MLLGGGQILKGALEISVWTISNSQPNGFDVDIGIQSFFIYFHDMLRFGGRKNVTKRVIIKICFWKVRFFIVGTQKMILEGCLRLSNDLCKYEMYLTPAVNDLGI